MYRIYADKQKTISELEKTINLMKGVTTLSDRYSDNLKEHIHTLNKILSMSDEEYIKEYLTPNKWINSRRKIITKYYIKQKSDDNKTEERMFSENQAIWCSLIPIIIVIILIICEVIKNEI